MCWLDTPHNRPHAYTRCGGDRFKLCRSTTLIIRCQKKHKHLHISNLKQFVFNPKHTDPADVARRDYMEFFIDSIIQHQGNSRRKTQMRFLVKWTDFDDSHNTWESWKNRRLTDALHTYLRLHGMSKIIPTEK